MICIARLCTVPTSLRADSVYRISSVFAGSADGGEIWDIIAILNSTCRLNDVDHHANISWMVDKFVEVVP